MIKNYLLIAFRNLVSYKLHTFINLIGLTIGLACFILILLWINDEFSYDKSLTNKDHIYQLSIIHPNEIKDANVPNILPVLLANEFSEISYYTRVIRLSNIMTCSFQYQNKNKGQKSFIEQNVCLVDTSFFSIFSYPLLYGDRNIALSKKSSVVLNKQIALKYFGDENPIGSVLTLNNNESYTVSGVFEQPGKSHLKFDFIIPIPENQYNDWNWSDPSYILTHENVAITDFKDKIANYFNLHQPYDLKGNFIVTILPITKSYLSFGRMKYIYIFSIVAILILFIAGINYVNLSTANFSKRTNEMLIRKIAGANRSQLMFQLIGESVILSFIALFLALIMVELILPKFNVLFDKSLQIGYSAHSWRIIYFLLIAVFFGLLAGIYPAILLSKKQLFNKFKSISYILKFRNYAMIAQFVISILLITCSIAVIKQLNYLQKSPLGFDPDYIIKVPFNQEIGSKFDSYSTELLKDRNILNITCGQSVPFNEDYKTSGIDWQGKDPGQSPVFRYSITTSDFVETFGMTILYGRSFLKDYPSDRTNYIVNEEAVKYMGLENPIGEKIKFWDEPGEIIGIVKDFHHVSLHRKILPHIISINPKNYSALKYMFIKIDGHEVKQSIAHIQSTTKKLFPAFDFEFNFIDGEIDSLYNSEQKLSQVIFIFTIIALFISTLGVFGMTAFLVEQKSKEIGIRKINGASVMNIIILFEKKIIMWIIVSTVIAGPIAFGISFIWLNNFAYKTTLPLWILFLSGGFTSIIALATSCYETVKAALKNPVKSLRYE